MAWMSAGFNSPWVQKYQKHPHCADVFDKIQQAGKGNRTPGASLENWCIATIRYPHFGFIITFPLIFAI